jgi:REP element-mobilizing transposase RayT
VVRPEHVHLLIRAPESKNPSVVIQALKLAHAWSELRAAATGFPELILVRGEKAPGLEQRETWGTPHERIPTAEIWATRPR